MVKTKSLLNNVFFSALLFAFVGCGSSRSIETFQIRWVNYDDTLLKISQVMKGEVPVYDGPIPTRNSDEQYSYTFECWSPEPRRAVENTTYKANYACSTNTYKITWINYDGTVLDIEEYEYGETPIYKGTTPTKNSTSQYSFEFYGWSPTISVVNEDKTYTAVYSDVVNTYKIIWRNYDRTVLDCETYFYGETPTYKGAMPIKTGNEQYSYRFTGWSPSVKNVTDDAEYVAEFEQTINKFTITWKNEDGTILDIETYAYGDIPNYKGEIPYKESSDADYYYEFEGWDKQIKAVTSNEIYTATFNYSYGYEMELYNNIYYKIKKCYLNKAISISIPEKYNKLPVTMIGDSAFANLDNLQNIVISKNINSIGEKIFSGCISLESITFPFLDKKLGDFFTESKDYKRDYVMQGTYYYDIPKTLRRIYINGGNIIPSNAFSNCSFLDFVSITDNSNNFVIKSYIPCRVNYYGTISGFLKIGGIYADDVHLYLNGNDTESKEIVIPYSTTSISDNTFIYCKSITSVDIPTSVRLIGAKAFYDCASLSSIIIPSGVTSIKEYAFSNCVSLSSLIIPDSVTEIERYVFSGACIDSLTLPTLKAKYPNSDKYESIFANFGARVKNVFLSSKIRIIEANTIEYYYSFVSSIERIVLPIYLEEIQTNSFQYSTSFKFRFEFHGSYEVWLGLKGKSELKNVHLFFNDVAAESSDLIIPQGTTTISSYSFYNCGSVKSVIIPDGVTSIGAYAFSECTSLESIFIPNSLETINFYAFSGCSCLKTINLSSVKKIGYRAFENCSSLESIVLNKDCSIDSEILVGCKSIVSMTGGFDGPLGKYFGKGGTVYQTWLVETYSSSYYDSGYFAIPSTLKEVTVIGVKTIKEYAFMNCKSIERIEVGDDVEIIDRYAFRDCSSLSSLMLGKHIKRIEPSCFLGCSQLKNTQLNIYDCIECIGLDFIGEIDINYYGTIEKWLSVDIILSHFTSCSIHLFLDDSGIETTDIVIPSGTTSISNNAFHNCVNIETVSIPESVSSIGYGAFYGCKSLTSIFIPASVSFIDSSAFYGCTSLTSISIPSSLTSICARVFEGCTSLEYVELPENVQKISVDNFWTLRANYRGSIEKWMNCDKSIPENYINSHYYVSMHSSCGIHFYFDNSDHELTEISIPDYISTIKEASFMDCRGIESVLIPSSVTSIGSDAFSRCISLRSISIPSSVTSIDGHAFDECISLECVKLSNGVKSIGERAFYGCVSLEYIELPITIESIGENCFLNTSTKILFKGTLDEYIEKGITSISLQQVYFYSENAPSDTGNYWHYVDDVPVLWQ